MTIIDGVYVPPKRIQRQRRKGWRKPAGNVINCTRPSKMSNPHPIGWCSICERIHTRPDALGMYRLHAARKLRNDPRWLDKFRAADYAMCFCAISEDCHIDILLELA